MQVVYSTRALQIRKQLPVCSQQQRVEVPGDGTWELSAPVASLPAANGTSSWRVWSIAANVLPSAVAYDDAAADVSAPGLLPSVVAAV